MTERDGWDGLPPGLRAGIEERVGAVHDATVLRDGLDCRFAATVTTDPHGRLFLKGVPDDATDAAAALQYEALLNPTVVGVGPLLRYDLRAAGWHVLVFERVDGRHADLGPGTRDLDAVRAVLTRMRALRVPPGITVPPLAARFTGFLGPGDAERLAGETLLHTDTNPRSILVTDITRRAYVVDWASPATGPAWVDAAYTAVRLMECDQPPGTALAWLATVPTWREADPGAVRTFVDTVCRHRTAALGERNAEPGNRRFQLLA
ncbi:aminoglycoside phosphotransferase [Streptomyces sp. NPDC058953]|uniref:aminoglycoside phosphotransferase n=1 Tax=unclassified Streptomyces TaxID=2593676 RepID=UPI0036B7DA0C